jgi:hypothetical protein
MSLDRHFKQGPMFGCSDRMCCGVYPPEDTDHCPECMVEWPCEVELLRQRAERAEAELEAFRDSGLFEMWTQERERAERAEAEHLNQVRLNLNMDAALARVRLLIEGNGYFRLNHYTITAGELRAALEGDQP